MCGHEGLDPGEWVSVLTVEGEFVIATDFDLP